MKPQKTIRTEAGISGKGLFGGSDVKVVFRPADVDNGIVFVRTDTPEPVKRSKRSAKPAVPAWEDVLLGVRSSGER